MNDRSEWRQQHAQTWSDKVRELESEIERLRAEVQRLHDIEQRMKSADNDATKFAIQASDQRKEIERLKATIDAHNEGIEQRLLESKIEIERLVKLLLRYLPEHDGYFHNDYLDEREKCEVCQLRKELSKVHLRGDMGYE
jgi:DNA repair exonuclease SbcCD ATPase subunit